MKRGRSRMLSTAVESGVFRDDEMRKMKKNREIEVRDGVFW